MSINGKHKGSNYENQVSRNLSMWLTKGQDKKIFLRSDNSGATYTIYQRRSKSLDNHAGDITSNGPIADLVLKYFCLECKAYKDIGLWSLITKQGCMYQWWVKHIKLCNEINKTPILVVKQNYKPDLFCTTDGFASIAGPVIEPKMICQIEGTRTMYIYMFKDVLDLVPDDFISKLERLNNAER